MRNLNTLFMNSFEKHCYDALNKVKLFLRNYADHLSLMKLNLNFQKKIVSFAILVP